MRAEQFLNDSAVRFAKKAAVVAAGREHSYAELARSSDRVAAALARHGISAGERIALFLDDSFEAVVSTFAILKAGAVAAPIDAASSPEALAHILGRTGAVAMITEARLASVVGAAMAAAHDMRLVVLVGGDRATASESCLVFEALVGGIGPGAHVEQPGPASAAALLLPSLDGAGAPAASTMSHTQYVSAAEAVAASELATASILSIDGLCRLLATIRAGATLVLAPAAFGSTARRSDGAALALAG